MYFVAWLCGKMVSQVVNLWTNSHENLVAELVPCQLSFIQTASCHPGWHPPIIWTASVASAVVLTLTGKSHERSDLFLQLVYFMRCSTIINRKKINHLRIFSQIKVFFSLHQKQALVYRGFQLSSNPAICSSFSKSSLSKPKNSSS